MKYNQVPRPNIENHYHIQELIEAQEKRSDERTYHRNKEVEKNERESLIKDAKLVVVTDFYCLKCKSDFKSVSIKEIENDWSAPQRIAFYKSKCDKGHWCIRLITDKLKDGFWVRSRLCALDRGRATLDILQPHETGYNILYGKPR